MDLCCSHAKRIPFPPLFFSLFHFCVFVHGISFLEKSAGWDDSLVVLHVGRWRKLWEDDRREGVNGERMVSRSVMNGCAI